MIADGEIYNLLLWGMVTIQSQSIPDVTDFVIKPKKVQKKEDSEGKAAIDVRVIFRKITEGLQAGRHH